MRKKYSTIRKVDDSTLQINEYTNYKIKKTIKISHIIAFICICAILFITIRIVVKKNDSTILETEKLSEIPNDTVIDTNSDNQNPFDNNGFLFPNSDIEYITKDDILLLKGIAENSDFTYQELLRFSLNEIYARRGYKFREDQKFDKFYSNYDWYINMKKTEVTWEMFNSYEQYNISLLIEQEKINGYR